ncbi:hypothetical protein ACTJKQ_14375 [Acidovorax sp. 22279]|uniref:hypothetical protein n=1 Tax=Acidovorax sp. 22279 TaxID=3453900 RepID=UPI003F82AC2F
MNIRELKRRLQPYSGFMKPAEDDGSDLGGEVIQVTNTGDADAGDGQEDRGDTFTPAADAEDAGADASAAGAASAAGDADGADAGDGRRQAGIPKARFDEVNEGRKEALRKLEEAQAEIERLKKAGAGADSSTATAAPAKPAAQPDAGAGGFDVDAKEQEYAEALYSGDGKKAASIRREINAHLVTEATSRAREVAATEFTARETQTLLKAAVQTAVAAYPWLNKPEGEEALDLIVAARDQRIKKGMPPHLALQEAVNKIAPKFAPEGDTPSRESTDTPERKDTRTEQALARGAADSLLQPPPVQAGIGNRATAARIDVESLTEEQYDALPEAEKKRLRGD